VKWRRFTLFGPFYARSGFNNWQKFKRAKPGEQPCQSKNVERRRRRLPREAMLLSANAMIKPMSIQELICQQVYGLVLETATVMQPKDDEDGLELLFILLESVVADCGAKAEFTKQMLQQGGRDVPRLRRRR
jgi:hypothetical protein